MDNQLIHNSSYFIDEINSSKAYKMTALYHYSGTGFKKASLNLGIFRNSDSKMVGVLQWGCSYQDNINLSRYVKDNIDKSEYYELNRFSMADSEGKNAESQAISLGIKWIKKYRPNVRLLVSYSGRKEGNYGYIYQATNWTYLGYFLSNGFWQLDGQEFHAMTVWYKHVKYGNANLNLADDMCNMYQDVRSTISKQFIYVMLLDKTLTLASEPLEYPKPSNEYPIVTKNYIYKQNDDVYNSFQLPRQQVEYFYEKDKYLFSYRAMKRKAARENGYNPRFMQQYYCQYDLYGNLERFEKTIKALSTDILKSESISAAIKNFRPYKDKYFTTVTAYEEDFEPPQCIDVPYYCMIDEIKFPSQVAAARYLKVSRQAVSQARNRNVNIIADKRIIWR